MKNVETNYRTQFDPNNIIEDRYQIKQVLNEYKKGAEYMYNGKPYYSFSRKNGNNIETVFVDANRFEQQKEYDTEIAKAWKKIETFKVETQTQAELNKVQRQTAVYNSIPEAQAYIKVLDEVTLKSVINTLLDDYKNLKKNLPSSREGNGSTKKALKKELKNGIDILESYKKNLEKCKYKYGFTTIQARVGQLLYYFPKYEQVSQIIASGGSTSDIPRIIESVEDAKRARSQEKNDAKHQQKMNKILGKTAAISQQNRAGERTEEALEAITNGEPIPVQVSQATDKYTYTTTSNGRRQNTCTGTRCCNQKSFNRRFGERFSNMLEQMFPEKMNRDPRQREAWTNIGSLVAVGGAIFMGIKAISSLKKGADGKRNRGGFAGWTAGTLALLNGDKVINTIQDAFNWHPAEKTRAVADILSKYWFTDTQAMNIADRYVGAPIATMSALHFIPIYELNRQHILQDNSGKIEFNYNSFENYLNTLDLTDDQKQQLLTQGQKIRDDNLIGLGLGTFGINTMSDLINASNGDQTTTLAQLPQAQEGRNKSVERLSSGVNPELFKHGLRAKTPTALDQIIKEYEDEKDTTGIKKLILRWMKSGLLEMGDNNKSYSLEEMVDKDPSILDLEKMTMIGFKNPKNDVIFETYEELFDAVYVTELIKYNFAGRPSLNGDTSPFHIDELSGGIQFNNREWYKILEGETTILRLRTLKKTLPTLRDNREFYRDYLNEWRRDTLKININATTYPMASKLGIDFYGDENEVKDIDIWLKKIKIDFSAESPTMYDKQPFKINVFGNLQFTAVDGSKIMVEKNLSRFPTIRRNPDNRKKLLMFLNDKNNGMCNW